MLETERSVSRQGRVARTGPSAPASFRTFAHEKCPRSAPRGPFRSTARDAAHRISFVHTQRYGCVVELAMLVHVMNVEYVSS